MKILKKTLALMTAAAMCAVSVVSINADAVYYADGCNYSYINNERVMLTGWEGEGTVVKVPATLNGRSVTNIARRAFLNDSVITGIDFSEATNLETIGMYAFSGCSALTSPIVFAESIQTIGDSAFEGSAVTQVNLNVSADYIPAQCFYKCASLTDVQMSDSVTEIGTYAFANCPNLLSVYIPESVETIANSAFYNDPNLTIYCYKDSYAHTYAEIKNIAYVLLDAEPQEYIYGDANSDGYVNISDVTDIQRAVAEMDTLDDLRKKAADVNGDGVVTIDDATILQMYLAEFATDYPIGVVTAQ